MKAPSDMGYTLPAAMRKCRPRMGASAATKRSPVETGSKTGIIGRIGASATLAPALALVKAAWDHLVPRQSDLEVPAALRSGVSRAVWDR